eukprot:6067128-Amphidinium_carterae.1
MQPMQGFSNRVDHGGRQRAHDGDVAAIEIVQATSEDVVTSNGRGITAVGKRDHRGGRELRARLVEARHGTARRELGSGLQPWALRGVRVINSDAMEITRIGHKHGVLLAFRQAGFSQALAMHTEPGVEGAL